jgi:hypothetical protein
MLTLYRKISIALLVLPLLFLAQPSAALAEEMTCPTPLPVVVDVKPADAVNQIKLSGRGLVPVAVLSTADFDASMYMPMMAHLSDATAPMDCSGAAAVRWSYSDVNGDGLVDLVFFFRVQDLALTTGTTEVMLMSHGMYGGEEVHIMGTDAVIVRQ